jgi:hypothetical protein
MIKKFEEFVNENYNLIKNWTPEEKEQFGSFLFDTCGYDLGPCKRMQEFIIINGYTFEDTMNIFNRLSVAKHPTMYMLSCLNVLFDIDAYIKRKTDILDEISDEYNGGKPLPVVIDINGKLLTGEVYYSVALEAYAEDEEDLVDIGYEWLAKKAEEEGILDDDQPDWVENNWELLDIYEVDLDKEFGWTEK